jgi:hypothetical protein
MIPFVSSIPLVAFTQRLLSISGTTTVKPSSPEAVGPNVSITFHCTGMRIRQYQNEESPRIFDSLQGPHSNWESSCAELDL